MLMALGKAFATRAVIFFSPNVTQTPSTQQYLHMRAHTDCIEMLYENSVMNDTTITDYTEPTHS